MITYPHRCYLPPIFVLIFKYATVSGTTNKTANFQRYRIIRLLYKTTVDAITLQHHIAIPITDSSRSSILKIIFIVILHNPSTLRTWHFRKLALPSRSINLIIKFSTSELVTGLALIDICNVLTQDFLRALNFFKSIRVYFKKGCRLSTA